MRPDPRPFEAPFPALSKFVTTHGLLSAVVISMIPVVDHPTDRHIGRSAMPKHYLFLIVAVMAETFGTSAIQASQQFTKPLPTVLVFICFGIAFYFLSLTLQYLPIGIMYAFWSGLGIVFIALIGWLVFGQKLDFPAMAGMGLILAGIMVINLFSKTATH